MQNLENISAKFQSRSLGWTQSVCVQMFLAPPDDLCRHLPALFLFAIGIGDEWYDAASAVVPLEPIAEHHKLPTRAWAAGAFGLLIA